MNDKNICKFITQKEREELIASNFIYESKVSYSGTERCLDSDTLYLILSGEGYYRLLGQRFKLVSGTLFFSFADIPYVIENTHDLKFFYISFTGGRGDELFRRFGVTPKNCVFEGYEGLLPLWQDSLVRANDENIDLLSESLLLYTFSKLKKVSRDKNDVVAFVLSYMEEHFTDTDCCLREVAQNAGYNEKYLSHTFKKQFGMGFSEYLRLLRIKHAVMLIENGVTSVKNVALLSGFSDPLYFSRVFTESVGVSPRNYRKE